VELRGIYKDDIGRGGERRLTTLAHPHPTTMEPHIDSIVTMTTVGLRCDHNDDEVRRSAGGLMVEDCGALIISVVLE
jgi:hypothetical protein